MATITFTTKLDGTLTNATSVVLQDATGTYGIKRNDTDAVVVASGTATSNPSTGTYTYTFTPPAENVTYTAIFKVVASATTVYREVVFHVGASGITTLVPSLILRKYLVDSLSLFSYPADVTTWPLYVSSLPDGDSVEDDAAAIYDTVGVDESKDMDGSVTQHYGLQVSVRSTDYPTGFLKATSVQDGLDSVSGITVSYSGVDYQLVSITRTTPVVALGGNIDDQRRMRFTINFIATIRPI